MRETGRYNRSENEYDIDHEINEVVDKTLEFIEEAKQKAQTEEDAKKMLKAIAQTILEHI